MALFILFTALAGIAGALALWRAPTLPRASWLLAVAAAPQIATILGMHIPAGIVLTIGAGAVWGWMNRSVRGVLILAFGAALNMLPMLLHGAMPISPDTLALVHVMAEPGTHLHATKDIVVENSVLWFLGDWIMLWLPGTADKAIIMSPGDSVMLIGLVRWLFARRPRESESSWLPSTPPLNQ